MKTICSHMKKFDRRYRATKDECGVYYLQGRFGMSPSRFGRDKCLAKIGLYDPQEGLLGVWAIGLSAPMARKRLNKLMPFLIDADPCADGFIGVFHEKYLDAVCEIVGVKKRQRWSRYRRQAAAERMRTVRDQRPPLL